MRQKNQTIYIKDWLPLQPRIKQLPCDSYYINLANKIMTLMIEDELDLIFPSKG